MANCLKRFCRVMLISWQERSCQTEPPPRSVFSATASQVLDQLTFERCSGQACCLAVQHAFACANWSWTLCSGRSMTRTWRSCRNRKEIRRSRRPHIQRKIVAKVRRQWCQWRVRWVECRPMLKQTWLFVSSPTTELFSWRWTRYRSSYRMMTSLEWPMQPRSLNGWSTRIHLMTSHKVCTSKRCMFSCRHRVL